MSLALTRVVGPVVVVVGVIMVVATTIGRVPRSNRFADNWLLGYDGRPVAPSWEERVQLDEIARQALNRVGTKVIFDTSYVPLAYPGGDVPQDRGAAADEIIRIYRKVGIDLQREINEDKRAHFREYPFLWFQFRVDPNIDHRRIPNLMVFFKRRGRALPISRSVGDYLPGEIVAWDLGDDTLDIGVVVNRYGAGGIPLVVHNKSAGPQLEDVLFKGKMIGHFRFTGLELRKA